MQENETISSQQPVDTPPKQPSGDSFSPAEEPVQEKKSNKWLTIELVALTLTALGVAGFFAYRYFQLKQQSGEALPTPTSKITTMPSPLPSPQPTTDLTAGWKTYINDKYDYEIKYPVWTVISEAKESEFSYETDENGEPKLDELKAIEQDKRFNYLFNKFSGKICVTLKYKFGYISISAPVNNQTRYVICSPTGVGIYAENVKDSVEIAGKQIEVSGILQDDPAKDNLEFDNVFFTFDLENGTKITYGSSFDEGGTLAEWEKIKPEIKQILSTLKFTD